MPLRFFQLQDKSLESHLKILGWLNLLSNIVILSVVIAFASYQFINFNRRETSQYSASVQYAVQREETQHLHFTRDYAVWDDMVEAVRREDSSWFESTFFGTLTTLDIQSFWIVSSQRQLFYAAADGYQGLPLPVFTMPEGRGDFAFFNKVDGRVFRYQIIEIAPHLSSQPLVEPAYLISAVHWDDDLLNHFGTVTQSSVILTSIPRQKESPFSMQYRHELNQIGQYGEPIFLDIQRENLLLVLFTQSVALAIILFIVILIPSIVLNLVLQRKWIIIPLSKIRAMLSTHTHFYSPDAHNTKNELKILSTLTTEYIAQEQQAVTTSEHMKVQAQRLVEANKRIREELLLRERLSLVVENSTNGVLVTDEKMRILYVNPSWEKLNGYTSTDVIGKTPQVVKSGKTDVKVYQKMWEALNSGIPFVTEDIINRKKDGKEWECQLSVYPIQEENKTINYVGIQQDISKQKEIDRMKTDFISLASHQLRTPLSALRWFIELLLKTTQSFSKDQQELLDNSYKSTLRMISLVNMLLNISRIESGRLIVDSKPTDLVALATEVITELEPRTHQKQIEIHTTFPPDLQQLTTDPQLIREVFANLLSNALKYSAEKSMVELVISQTDSTVQVSVKDQGIGIPEEDKDHIFLKFYRGSNVMKTETDGTGLGLYFIKEIVQTCGGKIWFESADGKGTTFFFTLPLHGNQSRSGEVTISPSDLG